MSIRKCVFTDLESQSKARILPKELGGDEVHNWCNSVPVNNTFTQLRPEKEPTELDMSINETFHLLELARLRVKFYEIHKNEDLRLKSLDRVMYYEDKLKKLQSKLMEKRILQDDQINKDLKIYNKSEQLSELIEEKTKQIIQEKFRKIWE
jgi:hypothetical protein